MQEYRLVPVDEWSEVNETSSSERMVDVKALSGEVWNRRRFILKVTAAFVIAGILIALLSPVGYKVNATLLPETQSIPASGLLQQFGGLLGLGGANLSADGESLPPELYPDIVFSLPYQVELLKKEVAFAKFDTTLSVYDYWNKLYTPSVLTVVKGYTLGLPGKIAGLFTEDQPPPPLPETVAKDSIISLTKYQLAMVGGMRKHIEIAINQENGLVNLSVAMPDPRAAAEVGHYAIELLKEYVTDYRTQKAEQYLQFVSEQTQKAEDEYQDAQTELAVFLDQNINLATKQALTELERLQARKELLQSKYSSLAKQLQQAKLEVQQKTPVLSVLQPIKMPVDNYKPQRKFIIIMALLAGLVLSVGYVVGRSVIEERKKGS